MQDSGVILALSPSLAGCATFGPTWSEISGDRYHRTILDRRPALVEKIDGYSAYAHYPIKVEPGVHEIELQGPALNWPGGAPLRTITLTLEPCKRYYLNAEFTTGSSPRGHRSSISSSRLPAA